MSLAESLGIRSAMRTIVSSLRLASSRLRTGRRSGLSSEADSDDSSDSSSRTNLDLGVHWSRLRWDCCNYVLLLLLLCCCTHSTKGDLSSTLSAAAKSNPFMSSHIMCCVQVVPDLG